MLVMSFNKKLLWGGLGWAIGGPIGAIMGYALGSMTSHQTYTQTRGGDFGAAMLVLFAAVMKADNELKKTELEFVKRFFIENFGTSYTKQRMELFKKILKQDIDIKSVCNQIKIHMDINSKLQLIHVMFGLSKADNNIHKNELSTISNIARLIGLNEKDSQELVYQTFFGSIELLLKNNNSALKLAQNIAVSGGTTEAAFKIFLDKKILHKTFERAINAAHKKSIKLSK